MFRFILCLSLLFVSCSKKDLPVSKQIVRLSLPSDPSSLDPRKARDLCSGVVLRMLFEGLMRTANDGSLEKGVAKDIQVSDDGLKYTFSLKEMSWSNGSPLTAFDFLFAWKSLLDPKFPSDTAYFLYPIKNAKQAKLGEVTLDSVGVYATDNQTLVVELEAQTPYFLDLLTAPAFFPVLESKDENWAQEASTIVSNGPFCVDAWAHADQLKLRKNGSYWDQENVQLEGVEFSVCSQDTEFRSFEDNKLDWAGSPLSSIPRDAMDSLKAQKKLEIAPFLATQICRVNTTLASSPLSNPKFRRALALAVDRTAIVEHVLQGGQTVATGLVPPEISLCKKGFFIDNSFKEARDLLAELEIPAPSIVISYYNNERSRLIAQTLQAQWEEKLGISVSLEAVEPKVYFQKISQKEFQIALGSWVADFSDPINFLEVFKSKENGTNNTGWENSEYIDLLNQSALCRDVQKRKEILVQAEKILMDEMPFIPIFHFALNYIKNDALIGAYVTPQGHLNLRGASFLENKN